MLPPAKLSLAIAVAALPACGGPARRTPVPTPRPAPAAAQATGDATGLTWRLPAELLYEVVRRDSLVFGAGPAAQTQISGKTAYLRIRPINADVGVEVHLDSVVAQPGSVLTPEAIDSSRGARWTGAFTPLGPVQRLNATRRTVLAEQLGQAVDFLLPRLPEGGLREGTWPDTATSDLRVDAFEATERATGTITATPVPPPQAGGEPGYRVTGEYRLVREGSGTQSGQSMRLNGGGARSISYNFSGVGRVYDLTARDSLALAVTLLQTGQVIPVRWHTAYSAILRSVRER